MGIAAGFVLRVVAGAAVIHTEPSVWILICTGLLAVMLGFASAPTRSCRSATAPATARC